MRTSNKKRNGFWGVGLLGLFLSTSINAEPVWTFSPPNPAQVTVFSGSTATVQYTVTNQSPVEKNLILVAPGGLTASPCHLPGEGSTCSLTVNVYGSQIPDGGLHSGPLLCEEGNPNQCYPPIDANVLNVVKTNTPPPVQQYTVTPVPTVNGSISPDTPQVVNAGATLTFNATPDSGYGVNQWHVDSTQTQTGGTTYQLTNITANHSVSVTFGTVTLTPSVSSLGLSVNCPAGSSSSACVQTNNALTGMPRTITITNTGSADATNVLVSSSGLPLGTLVSPANCGTITANGGTCIITVTPGETASSNANNVPCTSGVEPAGSVSVTADGGLSTVVNTSVLSYGCIYQGGFIYSIDDTLNTVSIGGKVASLVDLADPLATPDPTPGVIWCSNGVGRAFPDASYDIIPFITEITTVNADYNAAKARFDMTYSNTVTFPFPALSEFATCNGAIDGQCNTENILLLYNTYATGYAVGGSPYSLSPGPTNLDYYAAGLCNGPINNYSGWYLPAICEMDAVDNSVTCPIGTQSMVSSLSFLLGNPNAPIPSTSCSPPSGTHCLVGNYWSSTEGSNSPWFNAWYETFTTAGSSQHSNQKAFSLGVRCSRALTQPL